MTTDATHSAALGYKHHRRGELRTAASHYRVALRIDPAHVDARHLLDTISKQLAEHQSERADADPEAAEERRKYETIWQHDSYREFSPGVRGAQRVGLIDFLRKHKVKKVLDAGCGSGKLMRALMEDYPGEFTVRGFDISENCLDRWFDPIRDQIFTAGCLWNLAELGHNYDAVICTHVLEHIPTQRVDDVLANLRACTNKVCYLGIALFPDGFGEQLLGAPLHLTVKEPAWWADHIQAAGFTFAQQFVESTPAGRPMWFHALLRV